MLAKAVIEEFKDENELILTDVSELDITDKQEVIKFFEANRPELVINCAAYTAVDKAEEDKDLAELVNSIGPKNLAIASKIINAKLVHISTDYVFSGDKNIEEVYIEDEKKSPVTVYGITKLHGEENIIENTEKYYIFRTAWLYGDGNNFVRTMLKLGNEKDEINVVADQHGSPTYAVTLAKIIKQAVEKNISYGVYHTTNLGFTTWYDFTKEIFNQAKISCRVNPVTSEEFIRPAKRPKNSKLSKDKILKQNIKIDTWQDALKKYLNIELRKEV